MWGSQAAEPGSYRGCPRRDLQRSESNGEELDSWLPRSYSMDVNNDPRFSAASILTQRTNAFQLIAIAAILLVNLAIGQTFVLMQGGASLKTREGILDIVGLCLMLAVFLSNFLAVVVFSLQLYMTVRLETAGPTGFEMAKSFYLNQNMVTMRHLSVKSFVSFGIPVFLCSTCCTVLSSFAKEGHLRLAIPVCIVIVAVALLVVYMNRLHSRVFMERYEVAKVHAQPLAAHMASFSRPSTSSSGGGRWQVDA
mmetsp:Transcript_169555/g.544448  ORF Transcript_169555/g.544448 Transcript_169555/m.544448 type:complete len:252 (-) Transcript_169555:86-841(-)